jgi:uncharacterized YceG family protein
MKNDSRSQEERERARLEREHQRMARRGQSPPPMPPPVTAPEPLDAPPIAPPIGPSQASAGPALPPAWDGQSDEPAFAPPAFPDRPPPTRPQLVPHSQMARRVAIVAAAAAALLLVWFLFSVFQPFAGDGKGTGNVAVTVPKGASVGQIGDLLAAKDVVPSATKFGWRANWSGKSGDFKAGRYRLAHGMSFGAVIDRLAAGPNAGTTTVTIPEGRSRYEIAQQAAEQGLQGDYMAATKSSRALSPQRYGAPKSVNNLEGFLFPATYEMPAGANVDKLIPQQLAAFKNNIASVSLRYAKSKNLTTYDVLTIASLVEREVQVPSERKLVAAVIYNRLKQGIPLGIDATTRFETRNWTKPLTDAQLQSATPYNTRARKGLPPGPIGNPGIASIKAAARPASVKYLFYVANPCKPGTHSFSNTNAQFQQDVARYNAARAAAGGKQPSGC